MKKTLLAISMLMATTAIHAQSSITLYGTLDTGAGFKSLKNKNTGEKVTRDGLFNGVWSSSAWGLKGSEDLGDGLRATFKLESGINLLLGEGSSGRMFKTTTLGLSSDDWGSLAFGRVGNAVQGYAGFIAGPDDEEGISDISNTFSAAGSNKVDNTFIYTSPSFAGLNAAIGYSFNADGEQHWNSSDNVKLITSAIGYTNGPLQIALGYDRLKSGKWEKAAQSWVAAGSYSFDAVTLAMAVGQDINGRQSGLGTYFAPSPAFTYWNSGYVKDFKTTGFTVNATVPINVVSSAMLGWSMVRASSSFNNAYNLDKRQQNTYSAGYTYNLSKRTSLYALGAYATGFAFQNVRGQQLIVGLDHSF